MRVWPGIFILKTGFRSRCGAPGSSTNISRGASSYIFRGAGCQPAGRLLIGPCTVLYKISVANKTEVSYTELAELMRTVLTSAMILVLISVVALCPSIACPLTAPSHAPSGSCCHKPQTHPAPCPAKTVPDCPYSILRKSTTNPSATHAKWVGSIVRTEHSANPPPPPPPPPAPPSRLPPRSVSLPPRT